jgi:hypothetical protein
MLPDMTNIRLSDWAFAWVDEVSIYGENGDDETIALDAWTLTHPDLRLRLAKAVLGNGELAREITEDDTPESHECWQAAAPELMKAMRAMLPDGLHQGANLTTVGAGIPDNRDRQDVTFVEHFPEAQELEIGPHFVVTLARHPNGWRVLSVQMEPDELDARIKAREQDIGDGE